MNPIIVDAQYSGAAIIVNASTLARDPATKIVELNTLGIQLQLTADEARELADALITTAQGTVKENNDIAFEDGYITLAFAPAFVGVARSTLALWRKEDSIPTEASQGSKLLGTRAAQVIRIGDLIDAARKRAHELPHERVGQRNDRVGQRNDRVGKNI